MSQVRVVTDSTSDIPGPMVERWGIAVVPCQVGFGQESYRDGLDFTPTEFFELMRRTDKPPRTAGPAVAAFTATYRRLLEQEGADQICSIHLASTLSGTLNSAWAAAQGLPEPTRVQFVDSGLVSMGAGWVVVNAARLAQSGATLAQVTAAARDTARRVRVVAMIDTLDNLRKGGRITVLSAALGSVLAIKPLVSIGGGQVTVWGRVRSRSRALNALAARVKEWGALQDIAVLHAGAPGTLDSLVARLREFIPEQEMLHTPAGSALSSHLGLGAVGVCAVLSEGEHSRPDASQMPPRA